jgi:ribosomal protein S27E
MADFTEKTKNINLELACKDCGALLKFQPGTNHLTCEYCGAKNEIAQPQTTPVEIKENSLEDFLAKEVDDDEKVDVVTVKCDGCHGINTFDPKTVSDKCAFCGSPLVITSASMSKMHKPEYVLPFGIDLNNAVQGFKKWLSALWFAPSDLIKYADAPKNMNGVYLPYWTFDCATDSNYTGQRGEDYYVTENYTTQENGQTVTKQRQVTKTRWYSAHGNVNNTFDDLLIEASASLDKKILRSLEPWDLKNLVEYNDKYLSGFRTETFAVDLRSAYQQAKGRMEPEIESNIRRDIGGDRQMIHSVSTTYHDPTFKHVLLPVWVSAYRYNNKLYQFIINARTGEVQGQRPYSTAKIVLAVLGGLALIAALYFMFGAKQ